jgi:C-terminal processing protease CtpA/Prc
MGQAVNKLLNQSALAVVKGRIPASSNTGEDPGCWMRLGITWDQRAKLNRGLRIKDFSPGNKAEKAGLKIGDIVYSIGGVDMPSEQPIKFSAEKTVRVLGARDGKDFRVDALPTWQCIED